MPLHDAEGWAHNGVYVKAYPPWTAGGDHRLPFVVGRTVPATRCGGCAGMRCRSRWKGASPISLIWRIRTVIGKQDSRSDNPYQHIKVPTHEVGTKNAALAGYLRINFLKI